MQKIEKSSAEPKLLGLHMTWVFENEVNTALGMTTNSYFYLERINAIWVNFKKWKTTKKKP